MGLSDKQIDHPRFWSFSETANELLKEAMRKQGMNPATLQKMEVHAGRVVDGITALLLRANKLEAR